MEKQLCTTNVNVIEHIVFGCIDKKNVTLYSNDVTLKSSITCRIFLRLLISKDWKNWYDQ